MHTGVAVLTAKPRTTTAAASLPVLRSIVGCWRRPTPPVSAQPKKKAYVGVTRRMRALAWMGHGPAEIADLVGESPDEVERWLRGLDVEAYVLRVVTRVFDDLSFHFGPNTEIAERARAEGWAPPLAWDDEWIDNGNARPRITVPINARRVPLESQVHQALLGMHPAADLLSAEKVRVVTVLHHAGWSDRRIAAWLRWNPDGDTKKGMDAVCHFRRIHSIHGGGLDTNRWGANRDDEGFITNPAAA